jgi:phage terminase large subunit GpA-like protein
MMLYPGFMTINRLAKEWAEAQLARKAGDIGPLQGFINSRLAEPWKETEKKTELGKIKLHIGSHKSSVVPKGVQMLSCGVDIQLDHVWVSVDGWCYLSEVYSIYEGRLETGDTSQLENLDILRDFLHSPWPAEDDKERIFHIYRTAIDTGYRPEVVKDFCSKCTELNILQVRGDDTVRTRPYRATKIAGGTMLRFDLNVTEYKNRLYRLLFESQVPGPGYWHLNADITEELLGHLTAEEQRMIRTRRKKRYELLWVPKGEHLANHIWDCKVYSAFAAELAGATMLQDPEKEKKQPLAEQIQRQGKRQIRTKY